MKKLIKSMFIALVLSLPFMLSGCGGPGHVTVGVGVAVPGPWMGPYPGGGVWVGRPFPGHYYPLKDNYRRFVHLAPGKKHNDKPTEQLAAAPSSPTKQAGK